MRKTAAAAIAALCIFGLTTLAALGASAFEGVWKVKDTAGNPFEITLSGGGAAKATRGEGMTDTPHSGRVPPAGTTGHGAATDHHKHSPRELTDQPDLRRQQHAPTGVGVQDLRPLRGRPLGRSWTPPPTSTRL